MAFEKSASAGYLANHMARLFFHGLQRRIKPLGLAPAQFMTLLELWAEDGLTQRQLVERLDVEQATMANTLARMERDGLIVRQPHPSDKRAQVCRLTDKAKSLRGLATKAAMEVNQAALKNFDDDERARFVAMMNKAIASMREGGESG